VILTICAAAVVILLGGIGLYLSVRFPNHRTAGYVAGAILPIATAVIFSAALSHVWASRRDREEQAWIARGRHLQRLQVLLATESASLKGIARAVRDARYFALVGNDMRQTVWQDEVLTGDVEHHFPEYFREREDLLRSVLTHDRELGRLREAVSSTLRLTAATERYRADLVPALVKKCAGTGSPALIVASANASVEATRLYDDYRCGSDVTRAARDLFDRAADLAEAASNVSEVARRNAEETVLHGTCTFAPPEP
jgi:hypothetical protein